MRLSFCLLTLSLVLAWPGAATAQNASDKVYEAADVIDAARAEKQAGRVDEADRLLAEAEALLRTAAELDPELARVGYERARVHMMRGDASTARDALETSMKLDLPVAEHVRMADLLDTVRSDLGKPSLGVEWASSRQLRDAGIAVLAGGLVVTAVGMAVAYTSFSDAAGDGVTDQNLAINRLGWGLLGAGGAVALGGGTLTVVGQVKLERLRKILPGPWRLGRDGGQASAPDFQISVTVRF